MAGRECGRLVVGTFLHAECEVTCVGMPSDADLLAKVESELKYHMDDAGVPPEVQRLVYVKGFTSMRLFEGVEETRSEVRAALTLVEVWRAGVSCDSSGAI